MRSGWMKWKSRSRSQQVCSWWLHVRHLLIRREFQSEFGLAGVFDVWVADKSGHCRAAHSLCTTVSCDTLPPTPAGLLGTLVIPRYCTKHWYPTGSIKSCRICTYICQWADFLNKKAPENSRKVLQRVIVVQRASYSVGSDEGKTFNRERMEMQIILILIISPPIPGLCHINRWTTFSFWRISEPLDLSLNPDHNAAALRVDMM